MKIYAVIVTFNAMHHNWADRCLKSLRQSSMPVTPIVVDNASTDGTRTHIPEHYPEAIWMPQDHNLGFGRANNIGINYAIQNGAEFVLLLNQDATIAPNALSLMTASSDGESLISPLHLNGDGTKLDFMFRESLRRSENEMLDDLLVRQQPSQYYESSEICAACWLMPIGLINKIGGFNPLFFHYSEDNNYYHRLVYHQVKTLLVPQARMLHDRLVHGNMEAFNHKHLYRDLLLEATNINHSFCKCCIRFMKVLYHCYFYELPRKRYIIGRWFLEMCRLTAHAHAIYQSRKAERLIGKNWL